MMSLWTKTLVPSVFCLKIRDERCSTGFQILNVSGVQELSAMVFWGQCFFSGETGDWKYCEEFCPVESAAAALTRSIFCSTHFCSHPLLHSPCLLLEDGSGDICCKGFLSLPQLGRNRTICAGAHWEEIPSGSGKGTHNTRVCRGSGSSKQFLVHDASHRKCSSKNSNYCPVKNIRLKNLGFMGVLKTTPCYHMSWKPLVMSFKVFNHKKYLPPPKNLKI